MAGFHALPLHLPVLPVFLPLFLMGLGGMMEMSLLRLNVQQSLALSTMTRAVYHALIFKEEYGDLLSDRCTINKKLYSVDHCTAFSRCFCWQTFHRCLLKIRTETYTYSWNIKMFDSGVPYTMLNCVFNHSSLENGTAQIFGSFSRSSCCVTWAVISTQPTAQQCQNFMLLPRSDSVLGHQSAFPLVSSSCHSALDICEINAFWVLCEGNHMLFVFLCLEHFT